MTNFGAKILNNAISALKAQQAVIATAGNNIANVNTPGYSRRVAHLETQVGSESTGAINVGNGVRVSGVRRVADAFLERLLRSALSEKGASETENQFLQRIENLFNLTGERNTIGSALSGFFSALNDLSVNPSSIELRTNVIERAEDLISSIKETWNTLAALQTEADQRLATEIQTVNSLTSQIADLNGRIRIREAGGVEASDERDQRDRLMQQLAEKVGFSAVEVNDGTVTITLSNGFPLVVGESARSLEVTTSPSFSSGTLPPSLSGQILSYVVYDYDAGAGSAHIDLTQVLQGQSGTIGGLLSLRGYADPADTGALQANGTIVEVAKRVEALTRALLTDFNQTYLGPDRDPGTAGHQASSGDLDGNTPDVFGLFDFDYNGVKDVDGDFYPTGADLNALLASGAVDNFSSLLKVSFSDPRRFAAARDVSGGPPAAPIFAPGDASNITNPNNGLLRLQNTQLALSAGSFSLTATPEEGYNQLVGYVGNLKSASDINVAIQSDNFNTASNRRDEVSAVSLDEEFSSLIMYQKAYQASARMIRLADELLQQVVQLL